MKQPCAPAPPRGAGVLLPVSSLPSPFGIGSLGGAARAFVDFLAEAHQAYWQVLPTGPTGFADSPYQSFSAFAGNPWFVDLDTLCHQGLLHKEEYRTLPWGTDETLVDYGALARHREGVLRRAFARFADKPALAAFCEEQAHWLDDYALYMAIKAKQGGAPWGAWPEALRLRAPGALRECRESLAGDIEYHRFVQYQFFCQWGQLKAYAAGKGVRIIGDVPIYVAMDSADAWANPGLFQLKADGTPTAVAGVPPDAFSAEGQMWGNPLYRWDAMAQDGYAWWMQRLAAALAQCDAVRIDHFRALESYYAIPAGAATARQGQWQPGPGMGFIEAVHRHFPGAAIIAEDLGLLTEEVHALQKASGWPGMKVLQFAFDGPRGRSPYLPHNHTRDSVVYTGTHDNDTVNGWFATAPQAVAAYAMEYLGSPHSADINQAFLHAALASVGHTAIVPMADWLRLGSEGRINTPATISGRNWRWRMPPGALTPALQQEMARLTTLYGRNPSA
ncbi:4-alpha-glucanotransferase [Ruminococcaceae bacterium OttesenSCG-928-O06]|nr:4-alpha-glucanotransferase [Ruminococcaceae bacterium OttesenSCG-928-O06]